MPSNFSVLPKTKPNKQLKPQKQQHRKQTQNFPERSDLKDHLRSILPRREGLIAHLVKSLTVRDPTTTHV